MRKFRVMLVLVVLCVAFASAFGCASRSGWQKAEADEALKHFYVTRFEFGKIGSVDVSAGKALVIDGRNWNFSELLASVFQGAMTDRNISVGKLLPTKGGAYAVEELKVAGRTLLLSVTWYPKTGRMLGMISVPYQSGRVHVFERQQLISVRGQYSDDEAFFEGLKTELRPLVDIMLDEAFRRTSQYGLKDF